MDDDKILPIVNTIPEYSCRTIVPSTIWYISKYASLPGTGVAGSRGYLLMQEFARLGYRSVIITSDSNQLTRVPELESSYWNQKVEGVEIWWIRTLRYRVAKSMRRVLSWIHFEWRLFRMPKGQLHAPDVVIVSSLSPLTVINGLLLRTRYRCRLVLEIRDIWPLTITEEGGFNIRNPLVIGLGWIERLGYRHADAIVGTMPNLGEHVKNILGYERPVGCVPMGIDPRRLTDLIEIPAEYATKYLPKDKFVVAYVGSIGISNALDTLFECAVSMVGNEAIHFLVVGTGDLRKHYLEKYGHLPNLTFAPQVPKTLVQAVLAKCDLLYFSSHVSKVWLYGQSLNKVIDYMLAGKPIVASYTGYPSMINEAQSGTYVSAGDIPALCGAIEQYAAMTVDKRELIGSRGRNWLLSNRTYQKLAGDYLKILFP